MKLCSIIIISILLMQVAYAAAVLEKLANIDTFAFGGVGYAGSMSEGEKNYRQILSSPSALKDFEKLYEIGNIQAKCYALVGIYVINPQRFDDLVISIKSNNTKVKIMQGCIVTEETLDNIVTKIKKGEYQSISNLKK